MSREFNCLDKTIPLTGNLFVEASAGTGKTFAIEHIVARLLEEGIPIDQILLTTFTNKGVRDLKNRIHLRLLEEYKKNPTLLLKNGLRLINLAEIHTIHSFCYKMLEEYAFEAKLALNRSNNQANELLKRETLILDTLRVSYREEEFSPSQLMQLLRPFGKSLTKFIKKMTAFLSTNPVLPNLPPFAELEKKFLALIREEKLFALPSSFKKMNGVITAYDLDTLIASTPPLYDLLTKENLKKGCLITPEIEEFCQLMKEAAHPTMLFLRMAAKIQQREEKESLSTHLLLETMVKALQHREFRDALRKRYKAVIIDEFQDTDPLQWEILHSLYQNHTSLFMVVGDPKQSIYAFRGGDLPTFLKARTSFENIYSLSTNYRSHPSLLEKLNLLLSPPQSFGEIEYLPLKSGKEMVANDAGLFFFLFAGYEEELIFSFIAFEILRLKKAENLTYSSFAILLKDRFQIERLLQFLKERGLPAFSLQQQSITESPVFSLFELISQILYKKRSLNLIKQFALHPLIGWPPQSLLSFIDDPKAHALFSFFEELETIYSEEGLSPFLSHFLGRYRAQIAQTPQYRTDLTKMLSLLLSSPSLPTPTFFEEMRKKRDLGDASTATLPLAQKDAIQLLTTHMSKGLEFDYVFALGTSTRSVHEEILSSYETLDQEKVRLLYVALTRAKKRISILFPIEAKLPPEGGASPLELLLEKHIPSPFTKESVESLLDTLKIEHTFIDVVEPVREEELVTEEVTLCEAPFPLLPKLKEIHSFSSLAPHTSFNLPPALNDPIPTGKEVGVLLHSLLEKWVEEGIYFFVPVEKWPKKIETFLYASALEGFTEHVFDLVYAAFHTPLGSFCLKDIHPNAMIPETEFTYTVAENSLIKGFADLIFSKDGALYLLDWKFHSLLDFDRETLEMVMTKSQYHTQKAIYESALKHYFPELDLKGVFYFFLRGKEKGVYTYD